MPDEIPPNDSTSPAAGSERARTVAWADHGHLRARRLAMSGLDFFREIAATEGPQVPLYDVMGFRLTDVAEGRSRFECVPGEHLFNPLGTIHGGLAATMIDSATGVSVQTTLEPGYIPATVRLHVDFVRPMTAETGLIVCEGSVARPGRQVALADATITDGAGKLCARGSATFMVTKRDEGPAAPPPDEPPPPRDWSTKWTDPSTLAAGARSLSGIETMRALARGDLPGPAIGATVDFRLDGAEEGGATFSCTPQEMHYNPMGGVHGGLAATLIDSATGCAVHSTLDGGYGFTTVYLITEYFKQLTIDTGEIRAIARLVRRGSRLAVADADLLDADGILYARGTATCLIFPFE